MTPNLWLELGVRACHIEQQVEPGSVTGKPGLPSTPLGRPSYLPRREGVFT